MNENLKSLFVALTKVVSKYKEFDNSDFAVFWSMAEPAWKMKWVMATIENTERKNDPQECEELTAALNDNAEATIQLLTELNNN